MKLLRKRTVMAGLLAVCMILSIFAGNASVVKAEGVAMLEFRDATKVEDEEAVQFTVDEKVWKVTISGISTYNWQSNNQNSSIELRDIPAGETLTFTLSGGDDQTTKPKMNFNGDQMSFSDENKITKAFEATTGGPIMVQLESGNNQGGPGPGPGPGPEQGPSPEHYGDEGYLSIYTHNDDSGKVSYAFATSAPAINAESWNELAASDGYYNPIPMSGATDSNKLFLKFESGNGKHLYVDDGFVVRKNSEGGSQNIFNFFGNYNNDPTYNTSTQGAQLEGNKGLNDCYDNVNDIYIIPINLYSYKGDALNAEFHWIKVKKINVSVDDASQYMISEDKVEIRMGTGKGTGIKVDNGKKVSIPVLEDRDNEGKEEKYSVDIKIKREYFVPEFTYNGHPYETFEIKDIGGGSAGTDEYADIAAVVPAREFKDLVDSGDLTIHLTVDKNVGVSGGASDVSNFEADFRMIDNGTTKDNADASSLDVNMSLTADDAEHGEEYIDAYEIAMKIGENTETEFALPVNISIPGSFNSNTNYTVVREHEGQNPEELECEVVDGKLVFQTDKFSKFSIKGTPKRTPIIPPSNPTEDYTVPVEGANTVQIGAAISDGTATVSEITQENIEKVINEGAAGSSQGTDTITIDLSGAKQEVSAVTLTKTSVETLADVVSDEGNNVKTVEIKLTNVTVTFDSATLNSISDQAKGEEIKLVVDEVKEADLEKAQQDALKDYDVIAAFDAYIESGQGEVHDFKNGNVTIRFPFTPEDGKDPRYYRVYYVDENGKMTLQPTKYSGGMLEFTTTHFSNFVVVFDDKMEEASDSIIRMYNPGNGDHFYTKSVKEATNAAASGAYRSESSSYFKVNGLGNKVYRAYNTINGDHFYTANKAEWENTKSFGYVLEGTAFTSSKDGKPVYRLYHPSNGDHFYTISTVEMESAKKFGYNYEGVAFYVD